jgi:hypothetical protein
VPQNSRHWSAPRAQQEVLFGRLNLRLKSHFLVVMGIRNLPQSCSLYDLRNTFVFTFMLLRNSKSYSQLRGHAIGDRPSLLIAHFCCLKPVFLVGLPKKSACQSLTTWITFEQALFGSAPNLALAKLLPNKLCANPHHFDFLSWEILARSQSWLVFKNLFVFVIGRTDISWKKLDQRRVIEKSEIISGLMIFQLFLLQFRGNCFC